MIAYQFLFITVISFLLTQTLAVDIGCWKRDPVPNPKDCDGAIKKILFDTKAKTPHLPVNEGEVRTIDGGCSLTVVNHSRAIVTEDSIRKAVESATKQCPGTGGWVRFSDNKSVGAEIRMRAAPGTEWEGYNPDFALEKPYCYQGPKGTPEVTDKDACIKAFANLPTDAKGVIMGKDNKPTNSISLQSKSCSIYMFTTDQSLLQVIKKDAAPMITKMVQECNKKTKYETDIRSSYQRGTLNLKGAEGPNGRVIVRTYAY
ncbi:hypothetical protein Pst134EA_013388 [Puccinia striiformis f. sp. tritici]|uniref:hypothetical protein n=1 Tax=Puccinia striiformis f. sp. tritici TaxID=168172 RepID=UPI0020072ED2|nr:hypothetical protein Pst134EA_013388 [Puccinia striiformis f. sp. tritici]KAH9465508.1 hypothetical protein Pst134EA_013388 [Puccinia striiformis f. sp. tritici]